MEIRNVAIIAHVDHGKTTLVDKLLQQSETFRENQSMQERAMDNNDIERERGITILAKATSIQYGDYRINIMDTPGHADFGGEVERIMKLVDGVLLLVDAKDGVMPQTKFVLRKALEEKLKPIVVINKIDRPFADPRKTVNQVFDLFIDLGATEEQLEFPIVYASGLLGLSSFDIEFSTAKNMKPLLDTIINHVPKPNVELNGPLLFQPALIDYNEYVGRMGIGKVFQGTLKVNSFVSCIRHDKSVENFRIQKLFRYNGLNKIETDEAYAGDIVAIAGLADIHVGDTITEVGQTYQLPLLHIDEPTVQMMFLTNNSPLAGKEGKFVTASKIDERLYREVQKDVSLKVDRSSGSETWMVSGRGELHLGILIESMRREGFEFAVSRPKVIFKEVDGQTLEPFEEVQVDTPNDYVGSVMELLGNRRGEMIKMIQGVHESRLIYHMPSRGLIGLMTQFLTATKGYGVLSHMFLDYRPMIQLPVGNRENGALISMSQGLTTAYAIGHLEDRGQFFVEPRVQVYEGMIVGIHNKDNDLVINCIEEKKLTNMRSAGKDSTTVLKRPIDMSLEACMDFINDDELIEITPKSIRLRKRYLTVQERKRQTVKENLKA
ncbi:Tyrosine phosphorylated protein A [Acholeplasma oculi]|uniref:Large ribosomal subunit assembly factor BipA n=1 Tax=Acholeplasma oculi TaxID=35623 RepID=A0A061AIA4_9MOLU|nr:translational GTPase TypA [Acholeplasma oculi]CDR31336.1 GTP-binding protein TypA [Acholeplasma oculi]SKC39133.1 GTP-binding protein [Acholeplasma oculi]SUT91671.1 Tyrosine phosphorylated protein A [Acholeplasma oculi]